MRINGETYYLWRAVDHEGEVLEVFVTKRRDRKAALRFLRKAMKRYGCPQVIVTDRLRSYQAAMREIGNETRQVTGRWLNNRAENSHQPFRRQERAMMKFRSMQSRYRNSLPCMLQFTTTSTNNATFTAARISSSIAPPPSLNGVKCCLIPGALQF